MCKNFCAHYTPYTVYNTYMIIYKDVLKQLKSKGYSTYKIRKDKLLSEHTLQSIRDGKSVSLDVVNILCRLLDCRVEDVIEYRKDDI